MNNLELVVVLKKKVEGNKINYIPLYSEIGVYDENNEVFVTKKEKKYKHILKREEYAFIGRLPLSKYTETYPKYSPWIIRTKVLINEQKHKYILSESEDKVPVVLQTEKDNKYNLYLDNDLINFYNKYYPELEINNIIDNGEMNISDVYKELTSKIIGQDEQIKQILSTIWKQYNNEDKTFNYNMLINGPEGVGKTTIFKLLEDLLGIPC